jgi:hypothetical protein
MQLMRRFGWLACGLLACALYAGCAEREHREVRVEQEQHESEVEDVAPGEMIVE